MTLDQNSRSAKASSRSNTRWLWFCLLLVPYLALIWRLWFVCDDAFISFRYARNLAHGLGLRFNPGESPPVEGFSNFLWTLICAAYEFVGLDLTIWVPITSIACGIAVLALVFQRLLDRGLGTLPALLVTGCLALFPPFAAYSTSGLETMAFALLFLLLVDQLILRDAPLNGIAAGVLAVLLCLIRVEGVAWAIAIIAIAGVLRLRREHALRPLLMAATFLAIGFGGFLLFRYAYFHSLVSNTAYAKGQIDWPHISRGFNYVVSNALTFPPVLLLAPISIAAFFVRPRGRALALAVLFWAVPFYSILVGGDFMGFGRFLIPAAPLGAILCGVVLNQFARRRAARVAAFAGIAIASISIDLLPAWNLHVVPESLRSRFRYYMFGTTNQSEYDRWAAQADNARDWAQLGKALDDYARIHFPDDPSPTFCTGAIGATGYYSRLSIYDHCGLVTPEIAHRVVAADEPLRSAGHDKAVQGEYFLKYRPLIFTARVIRQLTPADAADRCSRFLDSVRAWRDGPEPRPFYYGDFVRISDVDSTGRADYLMVQLLAPSVAAAGERLAEQERRVRQLAAGEHAAMIANPRAPN